MSKNHLNTNKQFMVGNGILAFAVFAVILIFLYMSFRFQRKAGKALDYSEAYEIELSGSFAGDSLSLYLNDSLLLSRTMTDANLKLRVNRLAEENVLIVVDNRTDQATPFSLSPKGSQVEVKKEGEHIYILEKE